MIAAKHDSTGSNRRDEHLSGLSQARDGRRHPKDPKKLTPDEKKKADEQQKILVQKNTPPS